MNQSSSKLFTIPIAIVVMFIGILVLISTLVFKQKPRTGEENIPPQVEAPQTGDDSLTNQLVKQSKIKKFKDYEELRQFIEDHPSSQGFLGRGGDMVQTLGSPMMGAPMASKEMSTVTPVTQGIGEETTDYSPTNIQVQGVDEGDIIKTDGKYIYTLSNNTLFIADANPAQSQILSKVSLRGAPQGIYIKDNRVVVYGWTEPIYAMPEIQAREKVSIMPPYRENRQYTFLKIFDVTDKQSPREIKNLEFEGVYQNSRMIGGYVYYITSTYNYEILDDELPVPSILENGQPISTKTPDIYYFDMPYPSYNLTRVAGINIIDQKEPINEDIYLMSSIQNIYVSQQALYITYTKYLNEYSIQLEAMREAIYPKLSDRYKERIQKIEAVDDSVLTEDEKWSKIGNVLERYLASLQLEQNANLRNEIENRVKEKYQTILPELEKTVIHKISLDKAELTYKTFGEVSGQVLNQFSMDEDNGYFRIATTKNPTWLPYSGEAQKSYNNLYILDENLKIAGRLEQLAFDERIYSVRFMQGRAYMVTFKQTDPLFVIDVHDPTNPTVLGSLKIPGFSTYLHPYDENTLIGLGRDTGVNEWGGITQAGLKLSLFDVRDVANPLEIDNYIWGDKNSYTNSLALDDHHAFLFSKDKELLVIPVESETFPEHFSGALVFQVTKQGFELRGKVSHGESKNYQYDFAIKRSLYIDDILYTLSTKYLKFTKLSDLSDINNIELAL